MSLDSFSVSRRTVLKGIAMSAVACETSSLATSASPLPSRAIKLPRATPESQGVASEGVRAFVEGVEKRVGGLHSFMLLRHGQVVAEAWWTPYAPQHPHVLFSLSKSFTSTAVGLAISDGILSVEAPVASFYRKDLPAKVSDNLAAMRIKHLLTMNTGHDKDATGGAVSNPEGNWIKGFFSLPVEHEPGSKFVYNSAATYMLSAIVQKVTGRTVLDYLTPRLFNPLGIEGQTWETCPKGINTGGWGLKVKTEDIARFGQLYLQKGQWQGKQLVPANWVAQATSKVVTNGDPATGSDWSQGYGYQFWQCLHGAYRGDGAFGQYCIVMPELDAVLAITSGVGDMQAVLTQVWEHLLPAMQSSTLPSSEAEGTLKRQLASLSVRPPEGKVTSPTAKRVSGKTYRFEANDQKIQSLTLRADGKHSTLVVHDEGGEHSFLCGNGSWVKSTTSLHTEPAQKSALWGAWTDENTFTIHNCLYETPFLSTIVCTFAGEQVTFSSGMNVGFGKTKQVPLVGRSG